MYWEHRGGLAEVRLAGVDINQFEFGLPNVRPMEKGLAFGSSAERPSPRCIIDSTMALDPGIYSRFIIN